MNSLVDKTLDDIKSQLTLLTQALTLTKKGKFLEQPQPNPSRQVHSTETSNQPSSGHEQVLAITTLRSGKVIDKIILPSDSKGDEGLGDREERESLVKRGSARER